MPLALPTTADRWQIYHNEALGYTFHYPPGAILEPGNDPQQAVTIRGPLEGNEYWPLIFIGHPRDRQEYHVPGEVDLPAWLAEHNLIALIGPEGSGPAPETRQPDAQIAGTTAVHTRFNRSPQSYAYDKYFFAHDGQLYAIVILHTADREEWTLYDRFLQSFAFTG